MASTYSDLKIQLMATGENSGTWGEITNTNLGTAIEEAITGSADVAFSSADVTLTLANTNETQTARNLRLNLTGTSGGNRNLIVPAIEKIYIINNGLANQVTVKNAAGTGVVVPTGKTMYVYNNGTNVVDAITHLTSLTLGSALPVASGGTGITSFGAGVATFLGTPSSANLKTAVTDETGSGALVFATSPTLVTPALGTPASGNLANCTFPTLNQNTTGNAATATTLQTARTIGGVSFNGSANINLPGVNTAGNQNTTGSAATLTTARTIGGVSFNGSANINLPGVNIAGNQNTSGNAATATSATNVTGTTTASIITTALGSGTADATTFLRGDRTFATLTIPADPIPSGTVMLFAQTAAPTGFTKNTSTGNNHALRIVTGTASSGGSVDFSTAFASQTPTGSVSITAVSGSAGNTTLSTPQIPSHSHTWTGGKPIYYGFLPPREGTTAGAAVGTSNTGGGGAHSHPFSFSSGSGTFNGNAINLAVKYVDVIRATKD